METLKRQREEMREHLKLKMSELVALELEIEREAARPKKRVRTKERCKDAELLRKFLVEHQEEVQKIYRDQPPRRKEADVLVCPQHESGTPYVPDEYRREIPRGVIGIAPRFTGDQKFLPVLHNVQLTGKVIHLPKDLTFFQDPRDCYQVLKQIETAFKASSLVSTTE
jgi:hypothetical protein